MWRTANHGPKRPLLAASGPRQCSRELGATTLNVTLVGTIVVGGEGGNDGSSFTDQLFTDSDTGLQAVFGQLDYSARGFQIDQDTFD